MGGNSLRAGALCSHLRTALDMDQFIPLVWVLECQSHNQRVQQWYP